MKSQPRRSKDAHPQGSPPDNRRPAAPRRHGLDIRRIYDDEQDGARYRVLVDRLWPRGVKKSDADLQEWLKDAAPSTGLRRWYGHDPRRFEEFARRYRSELGRSPASEAVQHLLDLTRTHPVTLITATRDLGRSGAQVLRDHVASRQRGSSGLISRARLGDESHFVPRAEGLGL